VVGIILIFFGTVIIPTIAQDVEKSLPTSSGNWLYVGGSGPGNYTKIQDAINDSQDGDTIFVFHGVYNEDIEIRKSLYVIGEDKNSTIIDGQYKIPGVVSLLTEHIYFSGFSIIHCRGWGNDYGLSISSYDTVVNNIISDNKGQKGICISGQYNKILNNIIRNNSFYGIDIAYNGNNNNISGNTFINNYLGIIVGKNHDNVISGNYIYKSSHEGIEVAGSGYKEISNNIIENNTGAAIRIRGKSSDVVVNRNIMKNNGEGLVIDDAQSLIITQNSFYDKGIQLIGSGLNNWTSHAMSDNSINEKPIYFFTSENNIIVPSDAGQVILASCTNCRVENLYISDVDYGIQLGFSSDNIITNNYLNNITELPIKFVQYSQNNVIEKNIISQNKKNAILIDTTSNYNVIHNNLIHNNMGIGIYLQSRGNTITNNSFENNDGGVYLDFSYYNVITYNNFINNSRYSISYFIDYTFARSNKFIRNFYDDSNFFLKIVYGTVQTWIRYYDINEHLVFLDRPGIEIDWEPTKESYDIPGLS
jgi:parallel beta-helix repeat protein